MSLNYLPSLPPFLRVLKEWEMEEKKGVRVTVEGRLFSPCWLANMLEEGHSQGTPRPLKAEVPLDLQKGLQTVDRHVDFNLRACVILLTYRHALVFMLLSLGKKEGSGKKVPDEP